MYCVHCVFVDQRFPKYCLGISAQIPATHIHWSWYWYRYRDPPFEVHLMYKFYPHNTEIPLISKLFTDIEAASRGEVSIFVVWISRPHPLYGYWDPSVYVPTGTNYDEYGVLLVHVLLNILAFCKCLVKLITGTIVDTDITHPTEISYFLASHEGIQVWLFLKLTNGSKFLPSIEKSRIRFKNEYLVRYFINLKF